MDFSPCWKCFWDMVEASKCLCSSFFGHFHNLCLKEDTCAPDDCFCYFLILTSGAHMRAPRGLSLSLVKLCWMILLEFWVMWHLWGWGLEKFKHISLATARMGLQMHCPFSCFPQDWTVSDFDSQQAKISTLSCSEPRLSSVFSDLWSLMTNIAKESDRWFLILWIWI